MVPVFLVLLPAGIHAFYNRYVLYDRSIQVCIQLQVYMEQESFSSNAIREMARIHAMQVHSINHKYEK